MKQSKIPYLILMGLLFIYGPFVLLLLGIPIFLGMNYHGGLGFLSFLIGYPLSVLWWCYAGPRWEYWAYKRIDQQYWYNLRTASVQNFLINEIGSSWEKYEIMTAQMREFLNHVDSVAQNQRLELRNNSIEAQKNEEFSSYRYHQLLKLLKEEEGKSQMALFFDFLAEHPVEMERIVNEAAFVLKTTNQEITKFFLPKISYALEEWDWESATQAFDHIFGYLDDLYPEAGLSLLIPFIKAAELEEGELSWTLEHYISVYCYSFLLDLAEQDKDLLRFYRDQLLELAMEQDELIRKLIFEACEEFLDKK